MARESGWSGLFWDAFKRSRNGMALLDDQRGVVEANPALIRLLGTRRDQLVGHPASTRVVGGPLMTEGEWRVVLGQEEFSGVAELRCDDGSIVRVQLAGHPETLTGRRYVLLVALSHTHSSRRVVSGSTTDEALSDREREVVRWIGEGLTGPEIAEELQIAHNTVRTHASNAMIKLRAHSRAHLVAKALGEGHLAA